MGDVEAPLLDPRHPGNPAAPSVQSLNDHWTRRAARGAYASATQLACSAFFGLITAWGLKTFGQSIAIALVLIFIAVQVLAYYGFAKVDLGAATRSVGGILERNLDVNKDGRVDLADVKIVCSRFAAFIFSWGLISVSGFVLGFYLGMHL